MTFGKNKYRQDNIQKPIL